MTIWEVIGNTYSGETFSVCIKSEIEPTEEQINTILYSQTVLKHEYEIYGYLEWDIYHLELQPLPTSEEIISYRNAIEKQREREKNKLKTLDRYKL